ncbi:MAG: T9SS type A sorting domain-containing protein [Dysgonamonadaceae bacterium]|jgi:hypothetical protein|nr:T9SS type A sorting domain-containing protein [Dysgonamonadaceae bacterium]
MKRIYNILLFALFFSAIHAQSPVEGLAEAAVTGLTANDHYTFHIYSADGKLNRGYSELFIALKDEQGEFVDDFTVSNFHPLMDMGEHKHSTPVGAVEKVAGKPLYKTWFAFLMYSGQMGGTWALDFEYTIGETTGKIEGAVPQVEDYPAGQKWIQAFNSNYYASIAHPRSYAEGLQTLQAYINERVTSTDPYPIVDGGYKIVVTPQQETTVLPAATLVWNDEKDVYEGTVNFTSEGLWTLYLKVLDAGNDALVAGADGVESALSWKINVSKGGTGLQSIAGHSPVKVYPTISNGVFTVETATNADIDVFNLHGQRLQRHVASAGTPLPIDLSNYGKGRYLISVKTGSGEVVNRKVIVK